VKWTKNSLFSWYTSEDGRYEIQKHGSLWEAYDRRPKVTPGIAGGTEGLFPKKYIGYFGTLGEAKSFVESLGKQKMSSMMRGS
jgi:hypothetical protein